MKNLLKTTSVILFVTILITFAFPFITFIYVNQNAIVLTGLDILQLQKEHPSDLQNSEIQNIPDVPTKIPSRPVINNQNLISLSAISASIGVATSNLRSPQSVIVTAIAGGLGSGALWYFKNYNEQIVLRGEEGVEQVDFGIGYLTSLASYIIAFILNLWLVFQKPR
jgi:hypothetical protein